MSSPQPSRGAGSVFSRTFLALTVTQFLGALNDNMFRWLVVPIGIEKLGKSTSLTLGIVCFTLPYLLLAPFAGYLADRFDKRRVIVWCKVAEIVLMLAALAAMKIGSVYLLFFVVALMGGQSALFSPAKFGAIPELLPANRISQGNGVMGMATVIASALGTFLGLWLYAKQKAGLLSYFGEAVPPEVMATSYGRIWLAFGALIGTAIVGWMSSLLIRPLVAADPARALPPNPVSQAVRDLRVLTGNVPLLRTALGIAFFWMLASLAQTNITTFGADVLKLQEAQVGLLMVVLVVGMALGSVLAGLLSGGRIELGIVPLGALGITFSACLLFVTGFWTGAGVEQQILNPVGWTCVWLFTLGVSAGLFSVPLDSYLQHRSDVQSRGVILAASNFVSFSFILLSGGLFYVMTEWLKLSPGGVFLVAGIGTFVVAIYVFRLLPQATIRFLVWLMSLTAYRVRVYGRENVPDKGGAVLVANHVSWLDGVLMLMTSSRPMRVVAYADYVTTGFVGWLSRTFGVIPIKPQEGPKSILRSLKTAQQAVKDGELVCIFAEGQITRTGQLQPFQRGLLRIVEGTGAPVIPVYLDELWGSIFSYSGGKFFWKKPRQWPYPISIHFGTPITEAADVEKIRQAVELTGAEAMDKRKAKQVPPPRLFVRKCRRSLFRPKLAESSGNAVTGGKLLTGTLVFKRLLERKVLSPDEKNVGVLLPPSIGGVIANTALTLARRVAINLNYTLADETVNYCLREAGIRHVLTSRKFLEKKPMQLDAELVFLEDLKEQATGWDKAVALLQTFVLPARLTERLHGLHHIRPDDLLTIVFTSGSTGEPKGVMLSQHNVMSNMAGVDQLFHFTKDDVILGVLPFFHSFGFTGTLWLPLVLEPKAVYHVNPLDARMVGKLCADHRVTIMMATPTFLRGYLKRCEPEQMKTLDVVVVGAEKMPLDLAAEFKEKFGVELTEGYGTTELSPVGACNVPAHRSGFPDGQPGTKLGTVGRPFPGVTARVINPETGETLPIESAGLLLIKGPNVMQGYLNHPEKTAEVIRDGWYNTGDIAKIDDDGFIEITGRQSRFSKIGGEMVPHIRIEETLARIVDAGGNGEGDGELQLAVTAVPDPRKGERLIVLHRPLSKPIEEVIRELSATGVPNLWIPDRDAFLQVDAIPILGTGKLDLRGIKQVAMERAGPAA